MCGIVGAVANRPIAKLLLEGLKRLEYRGYDSAGIAVMVEPHVLKRLRVVGKVRELEAALANNPLHGLVGIAHTRWATHGIPSEKNAHPFISGDQFALVHNGIIENHLALRDKLIKAGYIFISDTDSETAVHLIHYHYTLLHDLLSAVRAAVNELQGAYALGIFCTDFPQHIIGVRQGAPLVVGKGRGENFIASDPLALLAVTDKFIYLEDNDIVDLTSQTIHIYDKNNQLIQRDIHTLTMNYDTVDRGNYRHYMKKEIMEQPAAVTACLEGRLSNHHVLPAIFGPDSARFFAETEHVHLVACGTSYHAAMIARYWIESLAHIPCTVEVASEFRYRDIAKPKNSLFVALSQSGETADTLAGLRLAKKMHYLKAICICNAPDSTMVREADVSFFTHAGIEIGVASTKAFVTQLIALLLLALSLRPSAKQEKEKQLVMQLHGLPVLIKEILAQDTLIANWAKFFVDTQHAIFIGRGTLYPVALEGALKMKEISYIHAEGYPSGELKHGPLALVDYNMPIVAAVPSDALLEKNLSNLQEVRARGGQLYVLTDQISLFDHSAFHGIHLMAMPVVHSLLSPITYTIPLQLLAYHVAVLKGTDVDQPRNLAKSVTVE
jgi:glucosamine--fructose-6-phosphate aminotransferase (isomerizing)